jgi:DNA invertase Pin-like site-specific DNA recombinase
MKRAAIYARFSTDLQSERSIEDQVALCETFAAREGLEVVARFDDRARSGGSMIGRDGLMNLMEAARLRAFDVLVVEALDRLSRDMEDLAGLHKRLSFLGIEIRAVHEGQVNTMLVGLRGLIGQLYREDNAHKVRRGMAGVVRDGRAAGGLTYGYRVAGERGRRVIVEEEAAIVRRIFEDYLAGRSPRDIAAALNREGVRPPRGASWNASTINGSKARGHGILRNPVYAGRLVWNRVRMVKDPETGKRVSRVNPASEWQTADAPQLAIVPRDLFDAVQRRKEERSHMMPEEQRRPRRLLSGLLRCPACGGGMTVKGGKGGKDSRTRIQCSRHRESGVCASAKTFYLDVVERTAVDLLRRELTSPDVLTEYAGLPSRRRCAARSWSAGATCFRARSSALSTRSPGASAIRRCSARALRRRMPRRRKSSRRSRGSASRSMWWRCIPTCSSGIAASSSRSKARSAKRFWKAITRPPRRCAILSTR